MSTETSHLLERNLNLLREATENSPYSHKLYLVGGLIRDRALDQPLSNDVDIVLEGDALALATFLHKKRITQHLPVTYPRFGTAMVHIGRQGEEGLQVELVSARSESYLPDSRKPEVQKGTLQADAFRRDFTLNTLMQNLHSGEILDLTGKGWEDLKAGVIRTPLAPRLTFFDDPLRMLRAVRFSARFGFSIASETWEAIQSEAYRLAPPTISHERMREEFVKIALLSGKKFRLGMELLWDSGLLPQFLPEMIPMRGCTQGSWHAYDVWEHTLTALEALPQTANLSVRLALLWHDIAKPETRIVKGERRIAFPDHAPRGAERAHEIMTRLKFPNEEIRAVTALVGAHMRLGEYRAGWSDGTVRRLIRDTHTYLDDLFVLTECDRSAVNIPSDIAADIEGLRTRIQQQNTLMDVAQVQSPLNGNEIMELLEIEPGIALKHAKEFLTNLILEGELQEGDRHTAEVRLRAWWASQDQH